MLIENKFEKFKYILYSPDNVVTKLPLIIVLHGSGEVGSNLSLLKKKEPYLSLKKEIITPLAHILIPQLPSGYWTKTTKELKKLIDYIIITYNCNINNISITGHSLGGAGVIGMLLDYPNFFKAGAPLSPCVNYKSSISKLTNIPLWFFYGEKEGKYGTYTKEMYNAIKSAENKKLTCVKNTGHAIQSCWCNKEYKLFDWLISFEQTQKSDALIEMIHYIESGANITSTMMSQIKAWLIELSMIKKGHK